VIGEVHYNGASGYTPIAPYTLSPISEAGFKTLTATGVTMATQQFAALTYNYTNDPPAYYSAFAYALSPTAATSVNATFDSGGGTSPPTFSTTSITASLTTNVPNCFGIIFVFNDGTVGPLPSLTPPAGWTVDTTTPLVNTYPPMGGGAGMIAWHSTNPLPVGTTTVVVPNPTNINLLVEGVAIAP
jgi:hypothetical protein